jgi:hypothetical protein
LGFIQFVVGNHALIVATWPEVTRAWIKRDTVAGLFDRILDGWISDEKRLFATRLLEFNRQQLTTLLASL